MRRQREGLPVNPDHLALLAEIDEIDAETDERLTPEGEVIADWFFELSNARQQAVGMTAAIPQPLQFSEIHAWAQLTGHHISRWVLRLFLLLDSIYLKCAFERIQKNTK